MSLLAGTSFTSPTGSADMDFVPDVGQLSQVMSQATAPAFVLDAVAGFVSILLGWMTTVLDRIRSLNENHRRRCRAVPAQVRYSAPAANALSLEPSLLFESTDRACATSRQDARGRTMPNAGCAAHMPGRSPEIAGFRRRISTEIVDNPVEKSPLKQAKCEQLLSSPEFA